MLIYPAVVLVIMAGIFVLGLLILGVAAVIILELALAAVLGWMLWFFRDPARCVPDEENLLVAPADGRITDIELVEEKSFIFGRALRIGIFLSVFDVHINRSPCAATVEKITYKPGRFKNAISPESARVNESNDLHLVRKAYPNQRLLLRQISGAIARRIVCKTQKGNSLAAGEKFGMIKFGSRTELYLPADKAARTLVSIGEKVYAGKTPLVRYETAQSKPGWQKDNQQTVSKGA